MYLPSALQWRLLVWLGLCLTCLGGADLCFAQQGPGGISNANIANDLLAAYNTAKDQWAATVIAQVTQLFWTLALVSVIWTGGILILRRADIGDVLTELFRFVFFTGLFWWLLSEAPALVSDIVRDMRGIAVAARNQGAVGFDPSRIMDTGFAIYFQVLDQSENWREVDVMIGTATGMAILVTLSLVAIHIVMLIVSGWILAYAGLVYLGFGGARWTSDLAIRYFKTVLNVAIQLYTSLMMIGVAQSYLDQYASNLSQGTSLKELSVMLIVALMLRILLHKIPAMLGDIAMGRLEAPGGPQVTPNVHVSAASTAANALSAGGMAALQTGAESLGAAYRRAQQLAGSSDDYTSGSDAYVRGADRRPSPSGGGDMGSLNRVMDQGGGGLSPSLSGGRVSPDGRAAGGADKGQAERGEAGAAQASRAGAGGAAATGATAAAVGAASAGAASAGASGGSAASGGAAATAPGAASPASASSDGASASGAMVSQAKVSQASAAAAPAATPSAASAASVAPASAAGTSAPGAQGVAATSSAAVDAASSAAASSGTEHVAAAARTPASRAAASSAASRSASSAAGAAPDVDRESEVSAFRDRGEG